jgi:cell division protein FtsL
LGYLSKISISKILIYPMDLSKIPKPLLIASIVVFLLFVGYGAAIHVPGLKIVDETKSDEKKVENKDSKTSDSKSVKVSVFDETTQTPIVGASVIMESEGGSDSDTTDNN